MILLFVMLLGSSRIMKGSGSLIDKFKMNPKEEILCSSAQLHTFVLPKLYPFHPFSCPPGDYNSLTYCFFIKHNHSHTTENLESPDNVKSTTGLYFYPSEENY